MGLSDRNGCDGVSVMNGFCNLNDTGQSSPNNVLKACDTGSVATYYARLYTEDPWGEPYWCLFDYESCYGPLIVRLDDSDADPALTAYDVWFDLAGDGRGAWIGWTAANDKLGFLILDRNGNGAVDDGRELFGARTPLSWSRIGPQARDGFSALGFFDQVVNGGNEDGVIDARDQVFSLIKVWIDADHDGRSSPGEVHSLRELGIVRLPITGTTVGQRDQNGNKILSKSYITFDAPGGARRRPVFDVDFVGRP